MYVQIPSVDGQGIVDGLWEQQEGPERAEQYTVKLWFNTENTLSQLSRQLLKPHIYQAASRVFAEKAFVGSRQAYLGNWD